MSADADLHYIFKPAAAGLYARLVNRAVREKVAFPPPPPPQRAPKKKAGKARTGSAPG